MLLVSAVSSVSTLAQSTQGKSSEPGADASPDALEFIYPRIKDYGQVVRFPNAGDRPSDGSKICVDSTAGGPADKVNPAIEKAARFVSIYAGAGSKPVEARITIVQYGDATPTALSGSLASG